MSLQKENVQVDIYYILQETLAANPNAEFKLFESLQYGESDLLFKDATQCFVHTSHLDYRSILGDEFYNHVETVFNCTHSGMTTHTYTCLLVKQIIKTTPHTCK